MVAFSLLDGGWWGRWDEVPTAVRSLQGWHCPAEGMGVLVPKELVLGAGGDDPNDDGTHPLDPFPPQTWVLWQLPPLDGGSSLT